MKDRDAKKYYRIKYFFYISTIFFGTTSILTATYLDRVHFKYAIFQTILMFTGQFLCYPYYFVTKHKSQRKLALTINTFSHTTIIQPSRIQRLGKKVFCIASVFDFIDCYLEYSSYNILQPSGVMAFELFLVFNMFLYRVLILRKKVYRHQTLGLLIVVMGMILVSIAIFVNVNQENNQMDDRYFLAVVLMFVAQIFNMLGYISIEYFMYYVPITPEEIIGIKGITGLCISFLVYIPLTFLYDSRDFSLQQPFTYISDHSGLIPFIVAFIFISSLFNLFWAKTLKITDSLSLCTIDPARMIIFWILSYATENQSVNPLEIIGAFLFVLGLLVYNEVIVLKVLGLEKSAKECLQENEAYKELRSAGRSWQFGLENLVSSEATLRSELGGKK